MHFAEFLNEGFPAHLRILSPPTCVGFGTGGRLLVRSFSWQFSAAEFSRAVALPIYRFSALKYGDLPPYQPTAFDALYHSRAQLPSCVTPSSHAVARYWHFRQLSIAYAFRLGLGPDLPRDDERCPGFLRLSVDRILTCRFATHTGILTSYPSSSPSGLPSSR